jgi:hypothetical protein
MPGPDAAFSLAGTDRAGALLSGAGFGGIEFAKADEPMLIGRDADDVLEYERTFPSASEVLTGLSPAQAAELTRQVRDRLVAYASPGGVTMPGAAWLVTAQAGLTGCAHGLPRPAQPAAQATRRPRACSRLLPGRPDGPLIVQRRVSSRGSIMVATQKSTSA